MMKRIFSILITAAGLADASLRGDGYETVGDQLEHFVPSDYGSTVARRIMTENAVEDQLEELPTKDSHPLGGSVEMEGTDLVEGSDRREQQCDSSESLLRLELMTDAYPWETSYTLKGPNNVLIAQGPLSGSNFARDTKYIGSWCVSAGDYFLKLKDSNKDGFCCTYGNGYAKVSVNGVSVLDITDDFKGASQKYDFTIVPGAGRFGLPSSSGSNGNSGNTNKSCYEVKVVTKVDKWGEETSFKVKGQSGTVMSMDAVVPANSAKTVTECLPAGQYTITYQDQDGICCAYGEGYFEVYVEGEKLITGGKFQGTIKHDFSLGYDWQSTMNSRDRDFLDAHNVRRADWHARFNKPVRTLKWSKGLASDAKRYAQQLLSTCEENGIHHEPGIEQGENLAKNRGSGSWGEEKPAENFVKRWIDNEEFWGWSANAHLTQALWYATRYIGCGESVTTMANGQTCRFQVCRFAKAGNCMMGQYTKSDGSGWEEPMMMDDSPCGPMCPPDEGCFV